MRILAVSAVIVVATRVVIAKIRPPGRRVGEVVAEDVARDRGFPGAYRNVDALSLRDSLSRCLVLAQDDALRLFAHLPAVRFVDPEIAPCTLFGLIDRLPG